MRKSFSRSLLVTLAVVGILVAGAAAQTPSIRITTTSGDSILTFGEAIVCSLDAGGYGVTGVSLPMRIHYTNTNLLGRIEPNVNIFSTPKADSVFEQVSLNNPVYGPPGFPIDSMLYGAIDFGGDHWTGTGVLWRITVDPIDSGSIRFDTTILPPASGIVLGVVSGQVVPEWDSPTLLVRCSVLMGDCNEDGIVNSADIIYFVNYIFKSGPDPLPMRTVGDVNCSGGLTGADIIYLVNYFFKSGPAPCWCYVRII